MLMSLPGIIVLLAVRAAFGPSVWIGMIVFGILISPGYFRLTRTAVQSVRNELYVDAARVAGLVDLSIITRHIFSVVRAPIIIQTAMVCGVAIAIQSGLEFLGLGDPTEADLGRHAQRRLPERLPQSALLLWPGLAIGLTIGASCCSATPSATPSRTARRSRSRKAAVRRPPARTAAARTGRLRRSSPPSKPAPSSTCSRSTTSPSAIRRPTARSRRSSTTSPSTSTAGRSSGSWGSPAPASPRPRSRFSASCRTRRGSSAAASSSTATTPSPPATTGAPGPDRTLRGKRISYIPQEPMSNLDPAFTVGSQLVRPMVKVLGISKSEARKRALALLASVGIVHPQRTFDAYPHEVSGGMAQRVLIAGAISCEPDLIIADEPTTALDVTVQAEVLDLLRDLQTRLGVGVILVTHNFGVVADLADRVVVMKNGRVVEAGAVREILRNPQDAYTQTLLGSMLEGKTPMTMLTTEPERTGRMMQPRQRASLLTIDSLIRGVPGQGVPGQAVPRPHGRHLAIGQGETLGLVGESGSGKTTLGRAVLGLAPVTGGSITFEGNDISHASRRQRRDLSRDLQVVFQDPYTSLNPALEIGDILAEPLGVQGIEPAGRPEAGP